ncbi:pks3 [Symbiodinium necroappetens]|uniref:Pks3 protein n=1 Tax=Symbiodinium necroappetens TaxID=1628268 RepID=A0A812LHW7_9DINO|nr:pks3 [Symbiodinium necroappetens]
MEGRGLLPVGAVGKVPQLTIPCLGRRPTPPHHRRRVGPASAAWAIGTLVACRHRGRRSARCAEGDTGDEVQVSTPSSTCITPIGPFCPYRSSACAWDSELSKGMSDLTNESPEFAVEMSRMQLDMQMGREPDSRRMGQLADKLEQSYQKWNGLMTRLRLSSDFQSREYFKLTLSHLDGRSIEDLGKMVQYQVDCMRAVATGGMIPPVPVGVDMTPPKEGLPSAAAAPNMITAEPFDSSAFTNEVVKDPLRHPDSSPRAFISALIRVEYAALCRDHQQATAPVEIGSIGDVGLQTFQGPVTHGQLRFKILDVSFGNFDPLGKIAFLDQLEKIEERWDIFFGCLGLLGALSPDYKDYLIWELLKCKGLLVTILPQGDGETQDRCSAALLVLRRL